MSSLLLILLGAVVVCYVAITSVAVLKPFVGSDDHQVDALGVAVATAVTLMFAVPLSYAARWLVLAPLRAQYLDLLISAMIIMLVVRAVELGLQRSERWLPARPGFMLLMMGNCTVLGVALLAQIRMTRLLDVVLFAAGTGGAFAVLLLAFCALHQRLRYAAIPAVFREMPVLLITAGLMALAFMGFSGLIRE